MAVVLFQGNQPAKLVHSAGHCRERLANLMSDGRRQTAEGGHAILRGDLLFKPVEVGQVLEIENIPGAATVPGPERRNRDAQEAFLATRGAEVYFLALYGPAVRGLLAGQPEIRKYLRKISSAQFMERIADDFFSGAVQQQDSALQVGSQQSAPHRMDDVFIERLQVLKLFALFFELAPLAAQGLRERTPSLPTSALRE